MFLPPEVPTDQQTFTDRLLPQQLSVEQTAPAAWQPGSRHLNLRRPFARFMTLTSSRQHELHRRDSTVKAVLKASSSRLSSPAASVVELSKSRLTTSPMHSYTSPAFRRKSLPLRTTLAFRVVQQLPSQTLQRATKSENIATQKTCKSVFLVKVHSWHAKMPRNWHSPGQRQMHSSAVGKPQNMPCHTLYSCSVHRAASNCNILGHSPWPKILKLRENAKVE